MTCGRLKTEFASYKIKVSALVDMLWNRYRHEVLDEGILGKKSRRTMKTEGRLVAIRVVLLTQAPAQETSFAITKTLPL